MREMPPPLPTVQGPWLRNAPCFSGGNADNPNLCTWPGPR